MAIMTPLGRKTVNLVMTIGALASLRMRTVTGVHPCHAWLYFLSAVSDNGRMSMNGLVAFLASIRSSHCQKKATKPGIETSTGHANVHTDDQSIDVKKPSMPEPWHVHGSSVHPVARLVA